MKALPPGSPLPDSSLRPPKWHVTPVGRVISYVDDLYSVPYQVRRRTLMDMQQAIRRQPNYRSGPIHKVQTVRDRAIVMGGLGDYTFETVRPVILREAFSRVAQRPAELNGMGAIVSKGTYDCLVGRGSTFGGLGDWFNPFSWGGGKDQAWYDRVAALQKSVAITKSALTAIEPLMWNLVYQGVRAGSRFTASVPAVFLMHGDILDKLRDGSTALFVSSTQVPTDEKIAAVARLNDQARAMIEFVKAVVPQAKAAAEREAAATQQRLSQYKLESPSAEALKKFQGDVSRAAGDAFSFGKYAVPIGIAVVALILLRK